MRRNSYILLAVFGALAALFAIQLCRVFMLRFEYGDVYPPYCSYRADPLGTRAFYDALASLPGLEVQRNQQIVTKLGAGENTTLLLVGVSDTPDPEPIIRSIEVFVLSGGRLALTLDAAAEASARAWTAVGKEANEERKKEPSAEGEQSTGAEDKKEETDGLEECPVNITERWGFTFQERALAEAPAAAAGLIDVERAIPDAALPEKLAWRSPFYLGDLADHWQAVYSRENLPVVIERHWGKGSIVICADSYFLSNEAIRKHRAPAFLAWLIGPNTRVIVDEWHKGISMQPGLMALIRRYRLSPLLASLLILAGLFAWQNALSLVPKHDETHERQNALEEAGKDASAGLNNLLRRTVSAGGLVAACYTQWSQDLGRDRRYAPQVEEVRAVIERKLEPGNRPQQIVARYRTLCKILKERTYTHNG